MPKICPRCRQPGYGPYIKFIKGFKYWYMQHWSPEKRSKQWCYLGSDLASSSTRGKLRGILKAKSVAKQMFTTLGVKSRLAPEDILSRRTPGELVALIRVAKTSFNRKFKRVGPREYRVRDAV